jgi:hypothetical protein
MIMPRIQQAACVGKSCATGFSNGGMPEIVWKGGAEGDLLQILPISKISAKAQVSGLLRIRRLLGLQGI